MITNLSEKLSGDLPINRNELIELINSHGRIKSLSIDIENIYVKLFDKVEPKECYDLSNLNVSEIEDFTDIFCFSLFNGDISNWNVSNVKIMKDTFFNSIFNGDLSKWDVSACLNIEGCFTLSKFNNDSLKNWDVSSCLNMEDLFYGSIFNGDISKWNVSNVINMEGIFCSSDFNEDISKWEFNKNIFCDSIFYKNENFEKKYNAGNNLPEDTKSFLEWFNTNRLNISNANISNKEKLDINDYLSNFDIDKELKNGN